MRRATQAIFMLVSASLGSAYAQEGAKPLVLMELFTSQGCYSCPPAEKLLGDRYVDRDDVIALEMHVDYWDQLVYRGSSWRDPFSSPEFTRRQFTYATHVGRQPFTPQMIIQGAYSASGTDRSRIDGAIERVKELDLFVGWDVRFEESDGVWSAKVVEQAEEAEVFAVVYKNQVSTSVTGGENKGKELVNHNVVTRYLHQGQIDLGRPFEIGALSAGENCAVVIQRRGQGVVFGAWPCLPEPVKI